MNLRFTRLTLAVSLLLPVFFLLSSVKTDAQSVERGREQSSAVVSFSTMLAYDAAHPDTGRARVENEEDEDERPPLPKACTDSSQIRFRASGRSSYSSSSASSYLPASPAPVDTFQATYDNNTSIPPDTHGDIDSAYAITAINTSVHIQTRAGANVSSVSLNAFFASIVPGGGVFDPRVLFDPYSKRWILIADANAQTDSNVLLIAISQTVSPAGSWYMFRVVMDPGGTSWMDYPTLGYNKKWITIGGNRFYNSGGYRDARVFAFNKAQLLAGTGAPYAAFTYTTSFTISPAVTYDTTIQSQFCIESWDGTAGQLRLWKITGAVGSETMTSIGYPSTSARWQFQSFAHTSGSRGNDFAPQLGSSNKFQTNDDRIYDCKFINGKVWCSQNVFLPYSTTVDPTRCSAQWWQVDTLANPIQIGRLDDATNTNFYFFPAISVNRYDDALIGFSTSSAATYAAAAYAVHMHTDPADSMRPLNVYRHGYTSYYKTFSGSRNRWGDYSNSSVDPVNLTDFWTLQECASTTANRWDTWWAHVKVCTQPPSLITAAGPTTFCTGGNVVLNANTGTGYTYQWTVGGSDIAGATNSSYTATAAGVYRVHEYNLTCDSLSTAVTVTILTTPSAGTISGPTAVCAGSTITLTNGTGGGTWSSSASGTATVSTGGIVTGVTAGSAVISYTVTNICGSASDTQNVRVNALPTVAGISGPTTVCTAGSITLTNGTTGGVWTSGAPGTATINTTGTVTGVAAGTAVISYTVTNASGCTARATYTVTVNAGFTATITPAGPTTFCAGGNVVLNASTGGGYTYQWQLSGSNIAGATNSSYTATAAGPYTVVITSGACNSVSSAVTIVVNTVSAGTISGPGSVCIGSTITLTDATTGGTWSSGSTGVATINSSGLVTGLSAGASIISYSVTNSCGTAVATQAVAVNSSTTLPAITGPTTLCAGSSITLSNATTGGVWSSGSTGIATINTSGAVTGVAAGTAVISYTFTNAAGCVSRVTASITVTTGISAGISAGGPITFCSGGNVTLSATTGSGYTYQWQRGGTNITGATNATYSATTSGVYNAVISQGSCVAASSTITVTVNSVYAAPITGSNAVCTGGGTLALSDTSTGGVWSSSATSVATVNTSGLVYGLVPGTVVISYTVTNSCGSSTATKTVTVSAPISVAAITGTTSVCPGRTTTLANATSGGVWSSTNTSRATVSTSGVVTGITSGADTIRYSVTNASGCVSSAMVVFTVLAAPTATITPTGPTTFCTGGHVLLNATTGSGLTYQWKTGGVNISGATNSSYNATAGGNITVVISNASGCSTTSAVTAITVTSGTIVVPSVTITANPGTILCVTSMPDTFTANPVNGGSSPTYQWYVNGTATVTTPTMSYTPASGDIVRVAMTSNAACAFPDTTSATATVSVSGYVTPLVGISVYPNDTVCSGVITTLSAIPVYGGSSPTYRWTKNSLFAGVGASYSYLPANGDIIFCTMRSNYPCLSVDSGVSTPVILTVDTNSSNTITITSSTTVIAALGTSVTFNASAPHGGSSPAFQWMLNGLDVPGATNTVYTTTVLGRGQVVTCRVFSSDVCATPNPAVSNAILVRLVTGVNIDNVSRQSFTLMPNPNKGSFTITGNVSSIANGKVTIRISDVVGQAIYSTEGQIANGVVNEVISLNRDLANGIYLVNIITAEGSQVLHMVLSK